MPRASLLSWLARTPRLTELLPHLHQHALDATGGTASLLFEFNPRNGAWHPTSAFGLDELVTDPWLPEGAQRQLVDGMFKRHVPTFVADVARDLPDLDARLRLPSALLLPLAQADQRIGVLAIAFPASHGFNPDSYTDTDVSDGFLTVLELSRLRQREELQRDLQGLIDEFGATLSATLNLSSGLDVFCGAARWLFGADRTSVWIHDRSAHSLILEASSDPQHVARGVSVPTDDTVAPAALVMRRTRSEIYPTGTGVPTSTLAVPLRGRRRALGSVVFEGVLVERVSELDLLDRADELGRQLSGAIENLQLLEDAIRSSRERTGIAAGDGLPRTAVEAHPSVNRLSQSDKLSALGQFIAGIAHELNNPLQSVLGHLELMRATTTLPKALRREMQTVYREADRAARIVRNLLVFAGSRRLERRSVSVHAVLQKVLAARASANRSLHIEVVRHYADKLPRVQSDPLLLHQVFLNVLVNAEQAVATTGRPGRIEVRTLATADRVVVTMHDNGDGIPADAIPRLFEPFYTTKDVGKGTGLGLAIAYGIVQEHGGVVSAANHPEGGAVFTIELPVSHNTAP